MFWKKFLWYLDPRTMFRDPPANLNLRFMNGINRISIFLFLACLIVMLVRLLTR